MRKKLFSLALVIVFCMSFVINVPKVNAAEDWNTERYGDVLDIGPQLRALEKDEEYRAKIEKKVKENALKVNFNDEEATSEESDDSNFTFDGGSKYFLNIETSFKKFTLRSIGENVEIWVAEDLGFNIPVLDDDGNVIEVPDTTRPAHVVTQEQVDTMRDTFDTIIYPTDTGFFGTPDTHTGENSLLSAWGYVPENYYTSEDGTDKVIILVDNIRDDAYYDPDFPLFIAGFYSSDFDGYIDRNIISIDSLDWEDRLERTFFGTTTHEFQHLIHADNDPSEETWINEGMSDFAEYLCFGTHPMGHVNGFLDHPENSLVEWDEHGAAETGPETLADYGQAYLMQLFLNDHYGKDFIQTLAKNENQGIESVNEVLADFGADIDFEELFRRFTVAVAIDSEQPDNGIYNFDSIDINVSYESALIYDKDGVPAWGADYKVLEDAKKIRNVKFDGIEFMPNPWMVIDDEIENRGKVLWSNNGNQIDNQLILKADLTGTENPILKFDTFVDIEPEWDAGMVQISTDNGDTWTSLANENTLDQDHFPLNEQAPQIFNNLPGLSRNDEAWVTEEFDLAPYVGQEILINFRYMTDSAYNDSGWFIDNISIPEIDYINDCSSLDGFYSIDEIKEIKVDYAVTFINEKSNGSGKKNHYKVLSIDPFNITEQDSVQLKGFFNTGTNYMVVWYAAPTGKKGTVDFTYEIITQEEFAKDKKK